MDIDDDDDDVDNDDVDNDDVDDDGVDEESFVVVSSKRGGKIREKMDLSTDLLPLGKTCWALLVLVLKSWSHAILKIARQCWAGYCSKAIKAPAKDSCSAFE